MNYSLFCSMWADRQGRLAQWAYIISTPDNVNNYRVAITPKRPSTVSYIKRHF